MNIPPDSFITLVEYPDPGETRVQWTNLVNEAVRHIPYTDESESERERIKIMQAEQLTVVKIVDPTARRDALLALVRSWQNG